MNCLNEIKRKRTSKADKRTIRNKHTHNLRFVFFLCSTIKKNTVYFVFENVIKKEEKKTVALHNNTYIGIFITIVNKFMEADQ